MGFWRGRVVRVVRESGRWLMGREFGCFFILMVYFLVGFCWGFVFWRFVLGGGGFLVFGCRYVVLEGCRCYMR